MESLRVIKIKMIRIQNLNELKNINTDKKNTLKLLESSKLSNEDLKDYLAEKTGDFNVKTNDRKTLCRLITNHICKGDTKNE